MFYILYVLLHLCNIDAYMHYTCNVLGQSPCAHYSYSNEVLPAVRRYHIVQAMILQIVGEFQKPRLFDRSIGAEAPDVNP